MEDVLKTNKLHVQKQQDIVVVVVPLVAQGHLNAFLHLARRIAAHGLPVHYVSSSTHVRQAKARAHGPDSLSRIHFHDFPLPPFPTPPPNPTSSTTHFPSHLQPAFNAALHLKPPLAALLHSLSSSSSRRIILIHDSAMSFAATAASSLPNVHTYVFHTVSAIAILLFSCFSRGGRSSDAWTQELNLSVDFSFDGCFTEEFTTFIHRQHQLQLLSSSGRLFNTCHAIEAKFINQLSNHIPNIFSVGPLNPLKIKNDDISIRHDCLQWLDKQPKASVIYVSFGTTSSFSEEQIREMESGLELSGQRYLWVIRDADRGDIYANSKDKHCTLDCENDDHQQARRRRGGGGLGMVLRGWAPQLEILDHLSTAGFMTHCGWNSCMESMSMGVPMLTWPMHSDQPANAMLVTEVLKVGLMVRDWKKRNETVSAVTVRDLIAELMAGDGGKETRERARALGEAIRREAASTTETSHGGLDSFISHITNNNN